MTVTRRWLACGAVCWLAACSGDRAGAPTTAPESRRGLVEVEIATTGTDADLDGYLLFGGRTGLSASRSAEVPAGDLSVLLEDVAGNCEVDGGNPQRTHVPAGGSVTVRFDVACADIAPISNAIVAWVGGWVNAVEEGLRVITPEGAIVRQLTAARDIHPAVSRDGKRIAFVRDNGTATTDSWDLHIVNADGTAEPGPMLDIEGFLGWPTWSPDGRRIVFYAPTDPNAPHVYFDLHVLDLDDGSVSRLTHTTFTELDPDWSPDGTRIAFAQNHGGQAFGISLMTLDRTITTLGIPEVGSDFCPVWSPDGRRIAFMSSRETGGPVHRIYVMNADGSGVRRLTPMDDRFAEFCPSWSADGNRIVFERRPTRLDRLPEEDPELYTVRLDGTDLRPITDNYGTFESEPHWHR